MTVSSFISRRYPACAISLLLGAGGLPSQGLAADVVAVLSSRLGPYEQALQGFQQAFGTPIPEVDLSASRSAISNHTKVVVAFGARATSMSYPAAVRIVYCMAPGAPVMDPGPKGRSVRVAMTPPAALILKKIKILQPNLRSLGFLWLSSNQEEFELAMKQAAQAEGVLLLSRRLRTIEELPDQLRALHSGHAEALWIPPDPQLLTPENFNLIRSFARSAQIPFYMANEGFAEKGATGAVAVPFEEIGASAARVARAVLNGKMEEGSVYSEKVVLVVSESAARETGLVLTAEARKTADKVMP